MQRPGVTRNGEHGAITPRALWQPRQLTAEETLLVAIVQTAADDMLGDVEIRQKEAHRWLYAPRAEWRWPFSFVGICRHFGWDADEMRSTLSRRRPAPRVMGLVADMPRRTRANSASARIRAWAEQQPGDWRVSDVHRAFSALPARTITDAVSTNTKRGVFERLGSGVYRCARKVGVA